MTARETTIQLTHKRMNSNREFCNVCNREVSAPYRRLVDGVVVEGCVSAAHDGHGDAWHHRPEAVRVRILMAGRTV